MCLLETNVSRALPEDQVALRWLGYAAPIYRHSDLLYRTPAGGSIQKLESSVASTFLLSTDFFDHGADENREIRYVRYYYPYSFACGNPFAEL